MTRSGSAKGLIRLVAGAVLVLATARPARADVIVGASDAYGELISVTFTPSVLLSPFLAPITFNSGPAPAVSGLAPPPYSVSSAGLSVPLIQLPSPLLPLLTVTDTALPVSASSNVNGLPGVRFARAQASVNNLALNFGLSFPATPLTPALSFSILSVALDQIVSKADVTGDFPTLVATGSASGGQITIASQILGVGPTTTPLLVVAPNTQLIPAPFSSLLSVLLNEQGVSGNGVTSQAIGVNAVHITFSNIPIAAPGPVAIPVGSLSGTIILAHSRAALNAVPTPVPVPEPSSLSLALCGVGGLLGYSCRRRASRRQTGGLTPRRS